MMIRTFIAVDIPDELKKKIAAVQDQMKPFDLPVRWVSKNAFHITLKFLGPVPEDSISRICEQLKPVAKNFSPFQISLCKLGVFPSPRAPRVIWMGIDCKDNRLTAINEQIEWQMQTLGFKREERPFTPHLTLGRSKGGENIAKLASYIKLYGADWVCGEFTARDLFLYRSDLKPTGAVYQKLHCFSFGL